MYTTGLLTGQCWADGMLLDMVGACDLLQLMQRRQSGSVRLEELLQRADLVTQQGRCTFKLLVEDAAGLPVNCAAQIVGGLKRVLQREQTCFTHASSCLDPSTATRYACSAAYNHLYADKMPLVADSARPLLLALGEEPSCPDADDAVVVVMVPGPIFKERPDQLPQGLSVGGAKLPEGLNLVTVVA